MYTKEDAAKGPGFPSIEQNTNIPFYRKLVAGGPQEQQVSTKPHELEKALRIVKSNRSISLSLFIFGVEWGTRY